MNLEIIGYNDIEYYRKFKIRKNENILILKYPEKYSKDVIKFDDFCFRKNIELLKTAGRELKITISLNADSERSIKSNALLWKIYVIFSKAINLEIDFNHKSEFTTPRSLYDIDMEDYAVRKTITVSNDIKDIIIAIAESGENKNLSGHLEKTKKLDNNLIALTFMRTSSYWTQSEFSFFIDMKLRELKEFKMNNELHSEALTLIDNFNDYLEEFGNEK